MSLDNCPTRELVVVARRRAKPTVASQIVEAAGGELVSLKRAARVHCNLPSRLTRFHFVRNVPDDELDALRIAVRNDTKGVETAYIKPVDLGFEQVPPKETSGGLVPTSLKMADSSQYHLGPGRFGGVDAQFAAMFAGGKGRNVRIVDVERGWRFRHEDLQKNAVRLRFGSNHAGLEHGTAVLGLLRADENGNGITGIAPSSRVHAVSVINTHKGKCTHSSTPALVFAAKNILRRGDVLLIERQRRWKGTGSSRIPLEWWPCDYEAIKYATQSLGIIVVQPAGNDAQNLDVKELDKPKTGFPSSWTNPFRRGSADSGSIIVGAGLENRTRCGSSNYGTCVDVQGWGRNIVTTGYGDHPMSGRYATTWYTEGFGETSGAAAMIAGVVACLQGFNKARPRNPILPMRMRNALRDPSFGHDQPSGERKHIGPRPDLRKLIRGIDRI